MAIIFFNPKRKIDFAQAMGIAVFFIIGAGLVVIPGLNTFPGAERTEATVLGRQEAEQAEVSVDAAAALLMSLGSGKVLFAQNADEPLLIASLTKLMTAMVALDGYQLQQKIRVSPSAVATFGDAGGLRAGGVASVRDLIATMLITSSNDAAVALAESYPGGGETAAERTELFVRKMNEKARSLGLSSAVFFEPTGLAEHNKASAADVGRMLASAAKNPLIAHFTSTRELVLQPSDAIATAHLVNTNELLADYKGILAGKTGFTDEAGGNLAILLQDELGVDVFVAVVLGAADRESAMRTLLEWGRKRYSF